MTTTQKLHVGLLYGGLSTEHEVSVLSARNVFKAIDPSRYDVSLIRIDKQGNWRLSEKEELLLQEADHTNGAPSGADASAKVFLSPARDAGQLLRLQSGAGEKDVTRLAKDLSQQKIDVIFPVLHGTNGEDGTIQGLLKLVNIPFVGAGVVGSVLGMDKDVMKRLLHAAGLPVPRFLVVRRAEMEEVTFAEVKETLGTPFFIKPANAGSSVGISRITEEEAFKAGLEEAFKFDNKVLIEEGIVGREIECAVIGNEYPEASITGEIVTNHAFYSYDAKYIDEAATTLEIPANIPDAVSASMRALSIQAYKVLCCEGMARVDFFLRGDDEALINEINTIPGFTARSMFPVLWEHSGLKPEALVDRLIELAMERHDRDSRLQTSR